MTAPLWTIDAAVAACDGRLLAPPSNSGFINGISIDSRDCAAGDLFVALPGTAADGHQFLANAATAGASAALVSRPDAAIDLPQIIVEDSLAGLTRLAAAGRNRFQGRVVGITGSVGKTGSKDMLAHALASFGQTHASQRSFNNHIGVPLTIASLPASCDFAVQEMGMNAAGEIAALTRLAGPHVALITRIAGTHSVFFNSLADIAAAKAEIFTGLAAGGVAVLNRDDAFYPLLAATAQQAGASHIISFGRHDDAEFCLLSTTPQDNGMQVCAEIGGAELRFEMTMHGTHWALNALGVLGCVAALGLPVEDAAKTLVNCPTPKGRGRRYHGRYDGCHITLIDDSYNASPVSMRAALASMVATPPTIMVLGEMLELGGESAAAHDNLIHEINDIMPKLVIGLGAGMHHAMQHLDSRITACAARDTDAAVTALDAAVAANDIVFIKGSLGSGAWRVAAVLLQRLDAEQPISRKGDSYAA